MIKFGKSILKFLLILEYIALFGDTYGPSINYCHIRCLGNKNLTHTVCKRLHQCGPVQGCTEIPQDENFRSHILHQHNEIRNRIANGSDKGTYGNTGAKNMHVLSYDMELEYIAACSTNTCSKQQLYGCNDIERFRVSTNRAFGRKDNWTAKAVSLFYNRIKFITDAKQIHEYNPYPNRHKYRESFLRLVWADTRYIGCSRVSQGTKTLETILVCIYGPAEYVKGKPVYNMAKKSSEIASECKDGRNAEYPSLCGQIEPIPKGKMWTMFVYESSPDIQ